MRREALEAIDHKRGHTDGAALFWTLPRRRDDRLLRMLVRYEMLQDFLDTVTEHGAALGSENGDQLYLALADALDPQRPTSNYYLHHPSRRDGGYLAALVDACRDGCRTLPGYDVVRPLLIREAERAGVLVLNHGKSTERDAALQRWAARHFPDERELRWFELTAAASGWITTHALLALASSPVPSRHAAEATHAAYFPWLAMALTMLDSYADQAEDRESGNHSYVAHYQSSEVAVLRLCESIDHAARAVLSLPDGERHAVLLGCMVALYLSKDSARARDLRTTSKDIAAAAGTLPRLLVPMLRMWRTCNAQRAST